MGVVDQKLQADLFTLFALSQEQPFVSQDAQVDFKNKKKEENKKKANDKDAKEDEHQEKTTKQAARKDKIGAADSDDKVCDADLDDGRLQRERGKPKAKQKLRRQQHQQL